MEEMREERSEEEGRRRKVEGESLNTGGVWRRWKENEDKKESERYKNTLINREREKKVR